MSKEKKEVKVVREVEAVKDILTKYLLNQGDMPQDVVKEVFEKILIIEEDYNGTLKDFIECSSLVVKLERLFEVIGIINTISKEDEAVLDKTLLYLESYINSIKV